MIDSLLLNGGVVESRAEKQPEGQAPPGAMKEGAATEASAAVHDDGGDNSDLVGGH